MLFGSLVQRRGVPGSDADLLIVLWRDDRPFPERIDEWLGEFDLDFPVEVFPYTVEEQGNPLAQEALSKGMRLYAAIAPPQS
ncbi:MAG TPA: nucleotidyltransferase domain-containing protein [Bacillota bacterium]|nr:nucleotidyltransferase domain-containing protein [Bacillota bacterium]